MPCAFCLAALVFLFPRVMSFSAMRWASLARGHVVRIDSVSMREVTRLRRRAERWEDLTPRCRCFIEDIDDRLAHWDSRRAPLPANMPGTLSNCLVRGRSDMGDLFGELESWRARDTDKQTVNCYILRK